MVHGFLYAIYTQFMSCFSSSDSSWISAHGSTVIKKPQKHIKQARYVDTTLAQSCTMIFYAYFYIHETVYYLKQLILACDYKVVSYLSTCMIRN